jgi:hypothetical protein
MSKCGGGESGNMEIIDEEAEKPNGRAGEVSSRKVPRDLP